MSSVGKYQSTAKGIPAIVCVPTGEKIVIAGKPYRLLKMMYDLKGEYMPLAKLRL